MRVVIAELWDRTETIGAVDEANPPTPESLEAMRQRYIRETCGAPVTVRVIEQCAIPRFTVEPDFESCGCVTPRYRSIPRR